MYTYFRILISFEIICFKGEKAPLTIPSTLQTKVSVLFRHRFRRDNTYSPAPVQLQIT